MTGAEFLAYVKNVLIRTDKDDEIYESTADVIIDMRIRMLSDDYSTISTALTGISSVGDYELTLPTDFGHLIGDVQVIDATADQGYLPLRKISKQKFDQLYFDHQLTASNRNTGVPINYTYYGQKIYLGPAVDKTDYEFRINYTTENIPTISGATDPVPFTDKYRKALRHGVLEQVYRLIENYNEADIWKREYETDLSKIIANDNFSTDSTSFISYQGV